MGDDRVGGRDRRLQRRRGLPDEIGAEADSLGGVHAVADATGRDDRHIRQRRAHLDHRIGGGDAPAGEGGGQSLRAAIAAGAFHQRPIGAAGSRDIQRGHPAIHQPARDGGGQAEAHLLHHHRHMEIGAEAGDGVEHAAPVAVAAFLNGFLQGIEMDDERIRADHVHRAAGMVAAIGGEELGGAEIGEQQHIRRSLAQFAAESTGRAGLHRDALRADAEGDAQRLRRLGKVRVDGLGARRPAGHGGDKERRLQPAAEQAGGEVHRIEAQLRERAVDEAPAVESRIHAGGHAIAGENDVDMVFLAATGCVLVHASPGVP